MLDSDQVHHEFENEYHPVFVELKMLERDYPFVVRNQDAALIEEEKTVVINTYASLLFSAQDECQWERRNPREIRDALVTLSGITGFKDQVTDLVGRLVPASVFIVERLYFQNRAVARYFSVPPNERSDDFGVVNLTEWMYPADRIERLRDLVRKIWRDSVLTSTKG